jgi:hypothetical protein
MSTVKKIKFVRERMLYQILSGRWYDIIVLSIYAPTKDTNHMKDSLYEELEHVFDKFRK